MSRRRTNRADKKNNEIRNILRSLDSAQEISDLFCFEIKRCGQCARAHTSGSKVVGRYSHSHSCCEYQLWQTLLDKQITRATPLHPKCFSWINCRPESLTTEICLSEEQIQRKKKHARFLDRPRLFQLLPSPDSHRKKNKAKSHDSQRQLNVEVVASSFYDPWGWPLGISCSEHMVSSHRE